MTQEQEYMEMMRDTGGLIAQIKADYLKKSAETYRSTISSKQMHQKITSVGGNAVAFRQSANLANDVEFWRWMGANYPKHLGGNTQAIQQTALNNGDWLRLQLQGKGYEWDFMVNQRTNPAHAFSKFYAGDSPTQPGIDVTETGLLDSATKATYQNKAYLGKTSPNLHNTPKDAVVVTNQEKVAYASKQGYETDGFMDASTIRNRRDARYEQARAGKAMSSYTLGNVATVAAKAGAVGAVIGMTTETIAYYRSWKNGQITDEEYLKQILGAGGEAGVTGGLTAAAMVPVQATITAAGASALLSIPVVFVLSSVINKIVAPCFGRGQYREVLNQAKYYRTLEDGYKEFMQAIDCSARQYTTYINAMLDHVERFEQLQKIDEQLDDALKNLYDSI